MSAGKWSGVVSIRKIRAAVHGAECFAVGGFVIHWKAIADIAVYVLVSTVFSAFLILRRIQETDHYPDDEKRERKKRSVIYSLHTSGLTGVLTKKFMFSRKGAIFFAGILVSLSLEESSSLETTYVVRNTKINNQLTMKSDDGLASDYRIYEESSRLDDVIPESAAALIKEIGGLSNVFPVSYMLGEIPLEEDGLNGKLFMRNWTMKMRVTDLTLLS